MLKPIIAALAFASVTACVAINVNEAPDSRPAGGGQTCNAADYQYLIGKTDAEIDRTRLPKAHRIVCHNCPVTMDFNENRLTVGLDAAGKVARASCG
ncbi:MAG: hypothetical protein JNM47_15930 [Hyphomonadaceae bacterium]|nr:hypothetical protein [Hyphomonadaceae bacterium]